MIRATTQHPHILPEFVGLVRLVVLAGHLSGLGLLRDPELLVDLVLRGIAGCLLEAVELWLLVQQDKGFIRRIGEDTAAEGCSVTHLLKKPIVIDLGGLVDDSDDLDCESQV